MSLLFSSTLFLSALLLLYGCAGASPADTPTIEVPLPLLAGETCDAGADASQPELVSEDTEVSEPKQEEMATRVTDEWIQNESPETKSPKGRDMPRDLLKENIQTTHYTAVVLVKAATVRDPHPNSGYVNHVYKARVIETIKGEHVDTIQYSVMADRDASLYMPSHPIIVSLCGSSKTGFYVPDNGYISSASDDIIKFARRVGARKPSSSAPACE